MRLLSVPCPVGDELALRDGDDDVSARLVYMSNFGGELQNPRVEVLLRGASVARLPLETVLDRESLREDDGSMVLVGSSTYDRDDRPVKPQVRLSEAELDLLCLWLSADTPLETSGPRLRPSELAQ